MGRPSYVKPRDSSKNRGTNRRDFLKRSLTVAAAASSAPLLLSSSGNAFAAAAGGVFQHGVASGDPLSDRVILWTRVTPATAKSTVTVNFLVALDPELQNVVLRGVTKTNTGRDLTVKVDADSLSPATTYYYRFSAEGSDSPIGRTRTLPVGETASLRMAVVSCSSLAHGYFNAYRRISERADLDLVVHLGDYIYEYASGQYGNVRAYEPANEIISLTDYRTRHAQYKRDADLQEVHRQHPMVAIWDDHEVANDSWVGGAQNHTEGTEGSWATRVANGLKAYYEWMPVRVVDTANLRKNNRSFSFGNLVDLIMLEERLNARSKQASPTGSAYVQTAESLDPARQMLGAEEESWLFDKLRTSTAKWKLVGQGVMLSQIRVQNATAVTPDAFLNFDGWDGYPAARDRVFDVLKGDATHLPVDNVVVLTGDIHSSWAADLTQNSESTDVASGGYDPVSGAGSHGVEFVGASVTSPGGTDPTGAVANALKGINPHYKYVQLTRHGYMVLDVDATRALCEWWYVTTVTAPSSAEAFGVAYQTVDGANRLTPAIQTASRANPPLLAP